MTDDKKPSLNAYDKLTITAMVFPTFVMKILREMQEGKLSTAEGLERLERDASSLEAAILKEIKYEQKPTGGN